MLGNAVCVDKEQYMIAYKLLSFSILPSTLLQTRMKHYLLQEQSLHQSKMVEIERFDYPQACNW